MAKITVKPSEGDAIERPSDMIVKQSAQQITVHDEAGRAIALRLPKPLQRLRFAAAMGEDSSNQLWSAMVAPLMYVGAIDGEMVSVPSSKREIEALFQRLDDHGLEAAGEGVRELLGLVVTEVDEAAAKK